MTLCRRVRCRSTKPSVTNFPTWYRKEAVVQDGMRVWMSRTVIPGWETASARMSRWMGCIPSKDRCDDEVWPRLRGRRCACLRSARGTWAGEENEPPSTPVSTAPGTDGLSIQAPPKRRISSPHEPDSGCVENQGLSEGINHLPDKIQASSVACVRDSFIVSDASPASGG
jgi:hypothetical protein